jgi:hypothetical protein
MFDWRKVCVGHLKSTTIRGDSGCTPNYGLVTGGGIYRLLLTHVCLTVGADKSVSANSRRRVNHHNPNHLDVRQNVTFWFREGKRMAFVYDDWKYLQFSSVCTRPALCTASVPDSGSERYFRGTPLIKELSNMKMRTIIAFGHGKYSMRLSSLS